MNSKATTHAHALVDALEKDGMTVEEIAGVLVAVAAGMVEECCGATYRRQWEHRLAQQIQSRENEA